MKQRGLLALLMLEPGRVVPVAQLVATLWPDSQADRETLYRLASRLRASLVDAAGVDVIVARSGGYLLAVDADQVDVHRFERLLERGRSELRAERFEPASDLLTEALGLWRGAALTGVDEPVRHGRAARLEELRLLATEDRVAADLALGRHEGLVPELRVLVAEHPMRERLVGPLMLALQRSGRRGEALEAYSRTRQDMVDLLGLEPSESLRAIHQRILTDDTASMPGTEPDKPTEPDGPAAANQPAPAQLPPDLASLTGRETELKDILSSADHTGAHPGAVVVSAIDGMAGIGKTALAVCAAHQLADRFPDGQLFIDLHGFTPGVEPVPTAIALDRLLRAIGVPGEQIPADIEERTSMWRSRMHNRRVLLLLDNAASAVQVRPLLPAAAGCLVIITSRQRLGDLEDAVSVPLDVLSVAAAVDLLRTAAGPGRLDDESAENLTEAAERCGRLPLAIRLLAARLRTRPTWRLTDLIAHLRDSQGWLAELGGGDRNVAAAFEVSYNHLNAVQRRLFRLLGLHPGTDFDAYAGAALADIGLHQAEQTLEALADAYLLEPRTVGRYLFHDLIRAHAADIATRDETEPDRTAAIQRLADYYLYATAQAMHAYAPAEAHRRPHVPAIATPTPTFDHDQALQWLDTERANLVALAKDAANRSWPDRICRLVTCLFRYLHNRAHRPEALALHELHLQAARASSDPVEEARALHRLGTTYRGIGDNITAVSTYRTALSRLPAGAHQAERTRIIGSLGRGLQEIARFSEARDYLQQAAALFHENGDHYGECAALGYLAQNSRWAGNFGQAQTYASQALAVAQRAGDSFLEAESHVAIGIVYLGMARYDGALEHLQTALQQAREAGALVGECLVLAEIGDALRGLERHAESLDHGQRSLAIATDIGDRNSQLEAHRVIGETLRASGRADEALDHLHQALDLATTLGQPHDQARAHDALGHAHRDLDQPDKAREHWQQALDIYHRLGLPDTSTIQAQLRPTSQPSPPGEASRVRTVQIPV